MRRFPALLAAPLLLVSIAAPAATPLPDGFHGLKWRSPVAAGMKLRPEVSAGDNASYTRPNDTKKLDGAALESVLYGYFKGQLSSVTLGPTRDRARSCSRRSRPSGASRKKADNAFVWENEGETMVIFRGTDSKARRRAPSLHRLQAARRGGDPGGEGGGEKLLGIAASEARGARASVESRRLPGRRGPSRLLAAEERRDLAAERLGVAEPLAGAEREDVLCARRRRDERRAPALSAKRRATDWTKAMSRPSAWTCARGRRPKRASARPRPGLVGAAHGSAPRRAARASPARLEEAFVGALSAARRGVRLVPLRRRRARVPAAKKTRVPPRDSVPGARGPRSRRCSKMRAAARVEVTPAISTSRTSPVKLGQAARPHGQAAESSSGTRRGTTGARRGSRRRRAASSRRARSAPGETALRARRPKRQAEVEGGRLPSEPVLRDGRQEVRPCALHGQAALPVGRTSAGPGRPARRRGDRAQIFWTSRTATPFSAAVGRLPAALGVEDRVLEDGPRFQRRSPRRRPSSRARRACLRS